MQVDSSKWTRSLPVERIDSHQSFAPGLSRCIENGVPHSDISAFNETMASRSGWRQLS